MNELYYKALEVKALYKRGIITQEQAKADIKPYADYYNSKVKELANKYHQKPKLFSFAGFMR